MQALAKAPIYVSDSYGMGKQSLTQSRAHATGHRPDRQVTDKRVHAQLLHSCTNNQVHTGHGGAHTHVLTWAPRLALFPGPSLAQQCIILAHCHWVVMTDDAALGFHSHPTLTAHPERLHPLHPLSLYRPSSAVVCIDCHTPRAATYVMRPLHRSRIHFAL